MIIRRRGKVTEIEQIYIIHSILDQQYQILSIAPQAMAQPVKGKTAILTGAGSGITLEFARKLLQSGCNVLIADLALRPEAEDLIAQYTTGAPRAIFLKTDVTSWSDLSTAFEVAAKELGPVSIVCPGAGVFEPPWSNFWKPPGHIESRDRPDSDRYKLLDINLTHPIRLTQLAISYFLASGPPVSLENPKTVIHISSISAQVNGLPTPLYTASKAGLSGFVRSLGRMEKKYGIRVCGVAPGVIKTPLWFGENKEKLKFVDERKDKWIMPEDVGQVMLDMVQKDKISVEMGGSDTAGDIVEVRGGSIVEVSLGRIRDVKSLNDPGPYGREGNTAGGTEDMVDDVWLQLDQEGWGRM